MEKLKALIKRLFSREIIMYLIFGVLTTLVSFAVYYLALFIGIRYEVANVISWVLSVTFAYITNKLYVFESRDVRGLPMLGEMARFYASRLATLAVEQVLLMLLVERWGISEYIAKIPVTVIVVVLNYVFSKLAVFTKKKRAAEEE